MRAFRSAPLATAKSIKARAKLAVIAGSFEPMDRLAPAIKFVARRIMSFHTGTREGHSMTPASPIHISAGVTAPIGSAILDSARK